MSLPTHSTSHQLKSYNVYEQDGDDLGFANDLNATTPSVPSLWGVPLKYISLVTLAVQNSMLTIIMHYSRVSTPPSRMYSAATAVLMNEVLKGSISLVIAFWRIESEKGSSPSSCRPLALADRARKLSRDIFSTDCWKLSIPAILYVIQNNLQSSALSNGFRSSSFLAVGVAIVQIQSGAGNHSSSSSDLPTMNATKGFIAVVAACFTSGLAGVYFEMVLKNSQGDLWVRNVQLSLFSLLPCIAHIVFSHESSPSFGQPGWFSGLFSNFGVWAWSTVLTQVLGGLVTAMVIKYSDNILKGFATSLSIVISFLASVALFDFRLTWTFIIGSAIVLNATWLYNQPAKRVGFVSGMDLKSWGASWTEKWRSNDSQPSVAVPVYGSGVVSHPASRTGSLISLSSLSSANSSMTMLQEK
ncbi:hypothetical protein D9758_000623 [Tetrapyrgos nigripes]|uniref:Nucleotide-sugar transporter n=1 Tax=Tetrapyrgos nigripes TaxID=182062 RepID=A0A8H5GYZ9_9AGAR|nr:hypothetical protein D9758_000623 [Tetrapyrgos nigripes]